MRTSRVVSLVLLSSLAACGDNGSGTPDAAPRPDGSVSPDAPISADAAVDAPVDAPVTPDAPPDAPVPSATSRVWFIGDFLVNNTTAAGAFDTSATTPATLPYGEANVPPVLIGNQTNRVQSDDTFSAVGAKTAFVADLTTAGRLDLYVAGPAGETPTLLVAGSDVGVTPVVDITAVKLSPDGTKVAYLRDVTIDGGYDLYVVDTTGTGTPVKVSPDRDAAAATPAALDIATGFTWSADSKYLGFAGETVADGYNQAWIVDTTAATPTAVEVLARTDIMATTGARGASAPSLRFDADGNLWFRARVGADADPNFTMYSATPAGVRTPFALPARGDASVADASTFGFTPDGTKIVFQADAPTAGAYNLFVQTLGQATATPLTTNTFVGQLVQHTSSLEFSPDGTEVAVLATYEFVDVMGVGIAQENRGPYVVKLDGTGVRRLAKLPTSAISQAFDQLAWSIDGTQVFALADYSANNETELFVLDASATDQTPTLAVSAPASGDVFRVVVVPAP